MVDIPAISGLDDTDQARVVLFQSGKQVHAPITDVGLLTTAAAALAYQPLDADLTSWAAITRGAGFDAFAAAIIGTSGYIVDSVTATYATNANLTTIIPVDDTIPTITEGTEVLSASITPKTTTNKLRVRCSGFGSCAANTYAMAVAIYQGSTCIDASYFTPVAGNGGMPFYLEAEYTPGATSAQTISVRVGPQSAGTVRLNGTTAGRIFGGAANATLVVEEIKA